MVAPETEKAKPAYRQGQDFPLLSLNSDEFESFLLASLDCIADVLGVKITGKPSGSGDGGFDVEGRSSTGRVVCIQCKRQDAPLDSGQVATELAKVAAHSVLDRYTVGEHRFICASTVRQKLQQQLREKDRDELAKLAAHELTNSTVSEISRLRDRLIEQGRDPAAVAGQYVRSLDELLAWDSSTLHGMLARRWSEVLQVAERYFAIATVVREYPRPRFDREAYEARYQAFVPTVVPKLETACLPAGMRVVESLGLAPHRPADFEIEGVEDIPNIKRGEFVLLVGEGGVGKSYLLHFLRSMALEDRSVAVLPVCISLADYTPNALGQLIEDELGITAGSWLSLPDHLLLLLDGLNECPASAVRSLLNDMKGALQRGNVTCVLTTREFSGHTNLTLWRTPFATFKVRPLTPVTLQRLAESLVTDGTCSSFVEQYRSVANDDPASPLWTPFSVIEAAKIWKAGAGLPASLGQMLSLVLSARADRNLEEPLPTLVSDAVLQLAGALAFETIIVGGKLSISAKEGSRWIDAAKRHCQDVLGIPELSASVVLQILAGHELIRVTRDGTINFGHQLTAGALAAPLLAEKWEEHLDRLQDSVTDDVWVFAARFIPDEEKTEYLQKLFDVDVIIGARAARELPAPYQVVAEQVLGKAFLPGTPESLHARAHISLAMLGSPSARVLLRLIAADEKNEVRHTAQMALAGAGDVEFLTSIAAEVDLMRSAPFKWSGGEIAVWRCAPVPIRIDIARRRLNETAPGEPVNESLYLIAFEGDVADAPLVRRHLDKATDAQSFSAGLRALYRIAPGQAREVFDEAVKEASDAENLALILRIGYGAGIDVDLTQAYRCVMDGAKASDDPLQAHGFHELIRDVIAEGVLPQNVVEEIERDLPNSSGAMRTFIWNLAHQCHSSKIAAHALASMAVYSEDVGSAANFFFYQKDLARANRDAILQRCEELLRDEWKWFDWAAWRVLALAGEIGPSESIIGIVSAMIGRLTRVRRAIEQGQHNALSPIEKAVVQNSKPEHRHYQLGRNVAQLVPLVARSLQKFTAEDKAATLYFDSSSFGAITEDLETIARDVGAERIDRILLETKEPFTRIAVLRAVCRVSMTDVGFRVLEEEIVERASHTMLMTQLQQIAEMAWSAAVFRTVVNAIAQIPDWPEEIGRLSWDFVRSVAARIDVDDRETIDRAIAIAKTPFAVRVLKLWREKTFRMRIGLARLAALT